MSRPARRPLPIPEVLLLATSLAVATGCTSDARSPPATKEAPASSAAERAASSQEMLEAATTGAKGDNKLLAQIALAETNRVREAGARYEKMAEAFGAAGGFAPSTMASAADVSE